MKPKLIKNVLLLILVFMAKGGVNAQNRLNIQASSKPLSSVMKQIEEQSSHTFFYNNDVVDTNKSVSLNLKDAELTKVLDTLCSELDIEYTIFDKNIVLSKKAQKTTNQFKGRLIDNQGLGIIGAAIQNASGLIAISDLDGYFTIEAKQSEALQVSCLGYADTTINADYNTLNYIISEDYTALSEVVVVGYGSQKRSDISGAIASVKAEELNKIPTTSMGEMLRGAAAGVQVTVNNAEPGGSSSVLIRGRRSLSGSNSPLYIVDGVPMSNIDDINANEIESLEILKDASSQSIYGARAANGVILVTTKRGTEDKLSINYSGYMAVQTVERNVEFYNGQEWAAYRKEAYYNAHGTHDDLTVLSKIMRDVLASGESVDWEKLMIHPALQQKHDVLIQSGNAKTKMAFGLGGYDQKGMVINSGFQRINGRINIDHKLTKNLSIGANLTYSKSWKQTADGSFNQFITMPPLAKVYEDDGKTLRSDVTEAGESHTNPLWNINNASNDTVSERSLYNLFLDWKIIDGLSYRLNASMNSNRTKVNKYTTRKHTTDIKAGTAGTASVTSSETYDYLIENILNYNHDFSGGHKLDATLMQSANIINYNRTSITGTNFPNDEHRYNAIGSALNYGVPSYEISERRLVSFLGRVRYNYKDRYLLSAAVRVDGSSVFGNNNKFAYFPSASFAWRVNNEKFMKSIDWISNLKLRLSWGQVGNQGIDPYTTLGLTDKFLTEFTSTAIGYLPDETLPNPNLKWETSTSTNIGLDFGFFKGRISGSVELYDTQTSDLLVHKSLSQSTGYKNQLVNLGRVQNRGIEVQINTIPVVTNDFEWSLGLMFSKNVNKIVAIDGSLDENGKPANDISNKWFIGKPMNVYYDYAFNGIWQTGEEHSIMPAATPGAIKLKDTDGDGLVTESDRVVMPKDPKWIGSLSTGLSYKGFNLSAELYVSMGGTLYNEFLTNFDRGGDMTGKRGGIRRNYWTANNPSNEAPAPHNTQAPANIVALGYQNASYIRLRNVQLSYNFPKHIKVYVTANNLWTKTEVLGYGPEGNTGAYPEPRTILLGLNLTF